MAKARVGITPSCPEGDPARQHILPGYQNAVLLSGAEPVPIDIFTASDAYPALLKGLDALLLSGGGDIDPELFGQGRQEACGAIDPYRDRLELGLMRCALDMDLPVLGVCRGEQVINVALGGTLIQDLPTACGKYHRQKEEDVFFHAVNLKEDTLLGRIVARPRIAVNSYHHQAVLEPAPGLVVSAFADDGVIEAIERPASRFLVGVQWHPESSLERDGFSLNIFRALIEHC